MPGRIRDSFSFAATAVFISGSGSTLQALLEQNHQLNIRLVISSKADVLGLLRAQRFGIETIILDKKIDWGQLHQVLLQKGVSQIALCGFMKIVPADFIQNWENKIINIHPSLLPLHKGLHAAEKSYENNDPMGVSLHYVNAGVDEGTLIFQAPSLEGSDDAGLASTGKLKISLEDSLLLLRSQEQNLLRHLTWSWPL